MSNLNVDSKINDAASKMIAKDLFGSGLSEMTELFQKLNVNDPPEVPEEVPHSKLKLERNNYSHGSSFYGHDDRVYLQYDDDISSVVESEISESGSDVKTIKYKKDGRSRKLWTSRTDAEDRWSHDLYVEEDQMPKTKQELIDTYGYDIRKQKSTPELKRRTLIVYNSKNKHEDHRREGHLYEYTSTNTHEHVNNKSKRFSEQRNRKLPEWYSNK